MPSFSTPHILSILLAVLTSTLSASANYDPAPLKHEHPGQIFHHTSNPSYCGNGVLTSGNSTGKFKVINGINTYLARSPKKPFNGTGTGTAILYLTDIFGVQLVNNRLLGDSIAHAGYFVVQPDLFGGDPVPADALTDPNSIFNMTAWRARHTMEDVDAIVETSIKSIRGELGFKKVGGVGYCFGGKYITRFLAAGKGLDAGFTAHPSGVVDDEWRAVDKPLSIAFGALDPSNTPTQRAAAEAIFQANNATYQTVLYSGAEHGFAVRTDLGVPQKRFAQEGAFWQAVGWVGGWV